MPRIAPTDDLRRGTVVVNIGVAHSEGVGGREGVMREKGAVYRALDRLPPQEPGDLRQGHVQSPRSLAPPARPRPAPFPGACHDDTAYGGIQWLLWLVKVLRRPR